MDKYFNIIGKKVNNEYSIEKKNNNNKIIIINDNLNTRLAVIHTRYSVSRITHTHRNIHSHINLNIHTQIC